MDDNSENWVSGQEERPANLDVDRRAVSEELRIKEEIVSDDEDTLGTNGNHQWPDAKDSCEEGGHQPKNQTQYADQAGPSGSGGFEVTSCSPVKLEKIEDSGDNELNGHKLSQAEENPYVCGLCDFRCYDIADLRGHLKTHFGRRSYSCTFCDYEANLKSQLKMHMKNHTGEKPFACGLCDYRCSQSNRLKIHMTKHTGERPYACDLCDYKCTIRYRLAQHMKKHTGEKPYMCSLCPYKCSDGSALKVHVRLHTGEKPYVCDICGYSCAQSTRLREHKMTHTKETKDTKEKRFGCDMCTFKCNDRSNLNAHKKRHFDRIFFCHMCEYKCTKTAELRVHMRIHSGEKPYACDLCNYRSAFVNNLNRHKRTHGKSGVTTDAGKVSMEVSKQPPIAISAKTAKSTDSFSQAKPTASSNMSASVDKIGLDHHVDLQPGDPAMMSAGAATVDLACGSSQMSLDDS